MTKRVTAFIASILLAVILMAAKSYSPEERFFRDVKASPPSVETPVVAPEMVRYNPLKSKTEPVYYTYPLKKINGRWAVAFKDMERMVGKKRISYFSDEKIVAINQMNRVVMAVDKPVVIQQSGRIHVEAYPTVEGDVLYVPLVFFLEQMGYTVNVSDDESRMVILPPEEEAKVVPARAVEVGSIHPYRDGSMATMIFDINGTHLWGWGEKVPGGMGSLFQLNDKEALSYRGDLALQAPEDYDEKTKTALARDGRRMFFYPVEKGERKIYSVPYAMKGADRVRLDGDTVYFQTDDGIYAFHPETKVLTRVVSRPVETFDVQEGRVLFRADGRLYLHEGSDGGWRMPEEGVADFQLASSYIVTDDRETGLVRVWSIEHRRCVATYAYDTGRGHSIKLLSGRYLALGQGTTVKLRDVMSDTAYDLDMTNIEDTLLGRQVSWLWNGHVLKGYVYGDGAKIAQSITVHP
ncbi:MAG: stalk domain-containing protein [Peptoniphilus sp.]|nr:stalk domain-containing protein [Peptoniphilus sp.]MDY3119092.1 stalk domain-containing protein [Peptoniphilus sp.]